MTRKLTSADVCEVSGYSRDELHAILKTLWPYCEAKPSPRIARAFSPHDLVVLSVTRVLEHEMGLRRTAVASLGKELHGALSGPKTVNRAARLVVTVRPTSVTYVSHTTMDMQGVVVLLGPIFEKLDQYLSFDSHPNLLGPALIAAVHGRQG